MRQKIVAGNWKMNKTLDQALQLAAEIKPMVMDEVDSRVNIILAPPAIYLSRLKDMIGSLPLAAQNCSAFLSGAYTGDLSAEMLKSVGAQYVIIGHSERREIFRETDQIVLDKIQQALKSALKVILCCGEPLSIREQGTHVDYVKKQLEQSLFKLEASNWEHIILAYEPIWAIGTGKTATSQQAQEMHASIRLMISENMGSSQSEGISILYGGSVKPDNAAELFACSDVDGGLIGGASLNARDFIAIAKSFQWS